MDKVKVLMRTSAVGKDLCLKPRKTYEIDRETALRWAQDGACVLIPSEPEQKQAVAPKATRKATKGG